MDNADLMAVKSELVGLGFDASQLDALLKEHGDEVLKILKDALQSGMSKDVVTEILHLGGVVALEILVGLKTSPLNVASVGMVQGVDVSDNPQGILVDNPLSDKHTRLLDLVNRLKPVLIEKLGPKLLELLVASLLK